MIANCGDSGSASWTAAAIALVWELIVARLTSNASSGAAPARRSATPTEIGPAKCHPTGPVYTALGATVRKVRNPVK